MNMAIGKAAGDASFQYERRAAIERMAASRDIMCAQDDNSALFY